MNTTKLALAFIAWVVVSLSQPSKAAAPAGGIYLDGNGKAAIVVRSPSTGAMMAGRFNNGQFTWATLADPGINAIVQGACDINGNGVSDLITLNVAQGDKGDVTFWPDFIPGLATSPRNVRTVWRVEAVGDLEGTGRCAIAWRYTSNTAQPNDTGVVYLWFPKADGSMGPGITDIRKRGGAPINWALLGAAKIVKPTSTGAATMAFVSPSNQVRMLMATPGRTCANVAAGNLPSGHTALKFADFSGNGTADILSRNAAGEVKVTTFDATGIQLPAYTGDPDDTNASCTSTLVSIPQTAVSTFASDPTWQFYATGDFNGDGITDIAWKRLDGTLAVWVMQANGAQPFIVDLAGNAPKGYNVVTETAGNGDTKPDLLFAEAAVPSQNNNAPITVYDRNYGTTKYLSQFFNQLVGADGFCYNPVTKKMHINARAASGIDDGTFRFPVYNTVNALTEIGPNLGTDSTASAALACTATGEVWYSRGSTSNSRIEVVKNNIKIATVNLNESSRAASRVVAGDIEMVTLNSGAAGTTSSLSVINIQNKSVTRTCTIAGEGYDMDVADGKAYVSVFRDANFGSRDVLEIDTATCIQSRSIIMPTVSTTRRAYAKGVKVWMGRLYVASLEGVRVYSLSTLTQASNGLAACPTGNLADEMVLGNNELHVNCPDTTIMVLRPADLSLVSAITGMWAARLGH